MSEEGRQLAKSAQCARIIVYISEMYGVSYNQAADIYYNSETAKMIEEGVADLHCHSDRYLAEEVWNEYKLSEDNS